ncbi:putative 2-dehydropantoate 2-reductase [Denitrificimonas sp. JX-1]|uniref:2-dehydropantoate 2-reductase n=1 Tax=Denitrificimonas halotolerans TaxID=3098930 RepID=A0ABU5GRI3_9GAMM|nr:putative 2-dehydropantoate 2-reductase [Denitrificimonas sp. JX-1]MDY7219137.1 putative 2-dehydropantoate 2-reductase [Denitrificimonas sp. JX-1]
MVEQRPRIGIIGTGAIGSFYGLMLARAGFEVHFLLRTEYAHVKRNGLRLYSEIYGELALPQVNAWNDVAQMPKCDWILVCAKTTSNQVLAPIVRQAAAPGSKVMLLQNGFAVEEQLRPLLDPAVHLLGGLCFIWVHRSAPGVSAHQAQGRINPGYHSGPATAEQGFAIAQQAAELFSLAGLESKAVADLQEARWQKLVWNVPYNGLSVLLDSDTKQLMTDPSTHALVMELMQEVVAAAAACGYKLPEKMVHGMLKFTESMPAYWPSMYHDFRAHRPMELQAIYQAPIDAAQAVGCVMPKTHMLLQLLNHVSAK